MVSQSVREMRPDQPLFARPQQRLKVNLKLFQFWPVIAIIHRGNNATCLAPFTPVRMFSWYWGERRLVIGAKAL
ncbi:MAG: hypothetical protein JWM16_398 [Verrucomicrobiales bacterium]|nr:hypothetical protein [Verrucomicrobiales bacterium]